MLYLLRGDETVGALALEDEIRPEAEEAAYFESILEIVRWLGFEPWKITYPVEGAASAAPSFFED